MKTVLFFPSLDGTVATAPLLVGCARYPLVVFVHGHCAGDPEQFEQWFYLPAQLAGCGYVVVVPQLAGVGGGIHPSVPDRPDLATLTSLVSWVRSDWEHADVLDDGPIGVVGHSFGALLGRRFAASAEVGAFASLSGGWHDWPSEPVPQPLTRLSTATLFVWGSPLDLFTAVPDAVWNALPPPTHRAIWAQREHWDYIVGSSLPCSLSQGPCAALGVVTTDLVILFFGKYVPPELATHLIEEIPDNLIPPKLTLTPEHQFYAAGHLSDFEMLKGQDACALGQQADPWPLLANRRSKETHSSIAPCTWVRLIAPLNRQLVYSHRTATPGATSIFLN